MDSLQAGWLQAVANAQASGSSPTAPPAEVKQEVDDTIFLTKEDLEKMRRDCWEKMRRDMKEKRRMSQLAIKEEVDMSQKLRRLLLERRSRLKRVPVPNTEANKRRCGDDQVKVKGESDDPIDLKRVPAASICRPAWFAPNPWTGPGVARPQKAQPKETAGSKEAVGSKGKGTFSRMLHPTASEKVKNTESAAKDARVQVLLERRAQNKLRLLESQNKVAQHKIAQLQKMLASEQQRCKVAEEECTSMREQLDAMSKETAELREQLQIKKSLSSLSSGASWQFEMEGSWEAFTPEGNVKMHQAYLEIPQQHSWWPICCNQFGWGCPHGRLSADAARTPDDAKSAPYSSLDWRASSMGYPCSRVASTREWVGIFLQGGGRPRNLGRHSRDPDTNGSCMGRLEAMLLYEKAGFQSVVPIMWLKYVEIRNRRSETKKSIEWIAMYCIADLRLCLRHLRAQQWNSLSGQLSSPCIASSTAVYGIVTRRSSRRCVRTMPPTTFGLPLRSLILMAPWVSLCFVEFCLYLPEIQQTQRNSHTSQEQQI